MLVSLATAFVVASSGCGGGGGGDDAPAPAPATPQEAPKHVVIDAEGDSTMWGFQTIDGKGTQTAHNPPAIVQATLQDRYGPTVTVLNHAIPSMTIINRMEGTGAYSQTYSQELASTTTHVVVVNFALNDTNNMPNESPQLYREYLERFVDESQRAGRIVVLEEPNPTKSDDFNQYVALYVQAMNEVAYARNIPIVRQFHYIQTLPNWKALLIDTEHPTDELYRIKAARQVEVLDPIVRALL
ncbi:SGNH/GDSL hydrolase family protein [Cupriavidus gilardii]|uniref:SGNH/GDSL hydrolase family protein n=1 Tax=Cupriavidus gilardii TaxID=82541 RepID=A0A849BMT0_9BURK|nr:SGNH/GDSL hydrolase family protein [Cupriavidus gilardii]KAB0593772.1 SGNH/GDSL hydrolase family protein [Cupriavidus gilardii]NNH13817.1 SGNH/GDSL hydrolase family protein [Cupriavidus gilardii]